MQDRSAPHATREILTPPVVTCLMATPVAGVGGGGRYLAHAPDTATTSEARPR
jgi:hypothetical protein